MTYRFDPRQGPVFINAEASGPDRTMALVLILDTGATTSLLRVETVRALGYDIETVHDHVLMMTGTETRSVPRVLLTRLSALGQHCFGFPVLAHDFPANIAASGLLGLDFLRERVLTLDFQQGQLALT